MLLPIVIAAVAAGAILLIFIGLAGGSSVDPVQARLTQLGSMQAKNLEELELQQPFIERTLRPLAGRLSGSRRHGSRARRSASAPRRASRSPATRATSASTTGSASRPSAPSSAASSFFLLFVVVGVMKLPFLIALLMTIVGVLVGYTVPEFWLGRRVQQAPEADPADDPGRPRPADDLRPRRPRLRCRARPRRREAPGPADRRVPPRRWPRSASARRAATRCATSSRARRSPR